jgi:hypothetical protein
MDRSIFKIVFGVGAAILLGYTLLKDKLADSFVTYPPQISNPTADWVRLSVKINLPVENKTSFYASIADFQGAAYYAGEIVGRINLDGSVQIGANGITVVPAKIEAINTELIQSVADIVSAGNYDKQLLIKGTLSIYLDKVDKTISIPVNHFIKF